MRTIIPPEVDMLLVSKSSRNQRKMIMGFAPKIGLSIVDYGKLDAIDTFYMDCQDFRDYYRDPYFKLPRPNSFKRHFGKCGNRAIDPNTICLSLPVTWVRESKPVVYRIDYGRNLELDDGIRIGGHYDPTSCIKYKR